MLSPSREVAGAVGTVWIQPGEPIPRPRVENPFHGNAHAIREGERLYNWFNCGGCHGGTGGAIGPNLQDGVFIYGGDATSIFASIYQGRPNGMPTWGGMIPEQQIWQIVAYLQDLNEGRRGQRPQQGRGGV